MIPDISHWHPVQNWRIFKDNASFAISKATEGTTYIDPTLRAFVNGCEEHHIPYWLYAFLRPGNEVGQTKFMLRVCKPIVGKYFRGYILDVESGNSAAGVQKALKWLEKNTVHKCMIYTMYAQYSQYAGVIANRASKTAWWEARYGANNGAYSAAYPPHKGCDLHQFTSNGYQPGVGTGTDLNRLTDRKYLDWFVGKTETQPEQPRKKTKTPKGTTLSLVYKTLKGKYGDGDTRKDKLGDRYGEVMKVINHICTASTDTLARETMRGIYGTGRVRRTVLGTRYKFVQQKVNSLLGKR